MGKVLPSNFLSPLSSLLKTGLERSINFVWTLQFPFDVQFVTVHKYWRLLFLLSCRIIARVPRVSFSTRSFCIECFAFKEIDNFSRRKIKNDIMLNKQKNRREKIKKV